MNKEVYNLQIDKQVFSVVSLSDQVDDNEYWLTKSPIQRMQHIEVLRRINYGHCATARLQRVLEYIKW